MFIRPEDRPAIRTARDFQLIEFPCPRIPQREAVLKSIVELGNYAAKIPKPAGYAFVMWDEQGVISSGYEVSEFTPYTLAQIPGIISATIANDLGVA